MHPTLYFGTAAVKSGVGKAIGMTFCLPVNVTELGVLEPRQLYLDRYLQLPEPLVTRGKDAKNPLYVNGAATLNPQARDTVVGGSVEQQRVVFGRVHSLASARLVVEALNQYGDAGIE
uniref:Uncharacterized protein n=1 Tax=Peronospora matthiolae TaxID=2874970 RepID=A0AAV1V2Q3_9STRA